MGKLIALGAAMAGIAVAAGLALAVAGRPTAARSAGDWSMAESAAAMTAAANAMGRHAETMRAAGERAGDPVLLAHARHWADDAAQLAERGAWMARDPAARASLVTDPAALASQGTLAAVVRGAGAMVHSMGRIAGARDVDLDALRWSGESMRDEGRQMGEHASAMATDIDQMVAHHAFATGEAAGLRYAMRGVETAAEHTRRTGQEMVDYVERTWRSLGRR